MATISTQKQRNRNDRSMPGAAIRAIEGEGNERQFVLSFSSEEPYTRWFGPEILDHADGAVNMTRLQEMGVVLFNHNRNDVIGRIVSAEVTGSRGEAVIEFDTDALSETVYQKVKSGTLKGVSVGYTVDNWEDVAPGKTSTDGRFTGPCSIARTWTPLEVSIVSVPADPTVGVGREMETEPTMVRLALAARQIQINKHKMEDA